MHQQRVWFVTGASRGFGRLWTEAALQRGDKVVATARDPKSLSALVMTHGDAILALPLDVTNRDAVFAAVNQAHQHFGRLDVILCNAGYGYMSAIEEIVPAEAQANFETNVFGTISVIQAALPLLRAQRRGHVLTMSSIGGVASFPSGGIYLATKFAVEALSEALAGEVAGVRPQGHDNRTGCLQDRFPRFHEIRADHGGIRPRAERAGGFVQTRNDGRPGRDGCCHLPGGGRGGAAAAAFARFVAASHAQEHLPRAHRHLGKMGGRVQRGPRSRWCLRMDRLLEFLTAEAQR